MPKRHLGGGVCQGGQEVPGKRLWDCKEGGNRGSGLRVWEERKPVESSYNNSTNSSKTPSGSREIQCEFRSQERGKGGGGQTESKNQGTCAERIDQILGKRK